MVVVVVVVMVQGSGAVDLSLYKDDPRVDAVAWVGYTNTAPPLIGKRGNDLTLCARGRGPLCPDGVVSL